MTPSGPLGWGVEELFEVLTWRQLRLHGKPVLLVDVAGFWAPLLAFLDAQRPPLLPTVSAHHQGGATIIQIQFSAPSPTGLLLASVTR